MRTRLALRGWPTLWAPSDGGTAEDSVIIALSQASRKGGTGARGWERREGPRPIRRDRAAVTAAVDLTGSEPAEKERDGQTIGALFSREICETALMD